MISVYTGDEGARLCGPGDNRRLEVSGENIDSLIIALGAGTSLYGPGHGAGADPPKWDRIRIFLFGIDDDRSFGAGGQVRKDGTFEIKSVSDGDYAILFEGLREKLVCQVGAVGSPANSLTRDCNWRQATRVADWRWL